MTDLHRLSIRELSEGLKQAQFSSRELTEHYLKRIAKIGPKVKSYVTVTAEQALIEAMLLMLHLKQACTCVGRVFQLLIKIFLYPRH